MTCVEENCVIISNPGELLDSEDAGFASVISSAKSHFHLTEGTDDKIEILEIAENQLTPDVTPTNPSLCDSGFEDSIEDLKLKCLECILELPSSQEKTELEGESCSCNIQEHIGFEEYVDDIFLHRLSIEDKYHVPDSLANQPEITPSVRGMIIQWLTRVHHDFKLCQDTLYLTVNILDRVFNMIQVSHDCLELLGVTCLLVSCKQNEVTPPEINQLLEKCSDHFSRQQIKKLETIVLLAISFDLMAPTTQQFFEYFASYSLSAGNGDSELINRLKMARAAGRCILELSLQSYEFSHFKPSLLALCVWKTSVEYLKTYDENFFPSGMQYTQEDYDLCVTEVHLFMNNLQQSNPDVSSLLKIYM